MEAEILYKEKTDSTMEDALLAFREGRGPGTVCWTAFQQKGRGRLPGRVWQALPGESLMLTQILPKDVLKLTPTLSLRIGLAVAVYLEESKGLNIRIKWPNDVYSSGKKLCGILCECRGGAVLAGLGLNLNQERFPETLPRAGSLFQLTGEKYIPREELTVLLREISRILERNPPLEEWDRRLLFRNERVSVLLGDPGKKEEISGILRGINAEGALRIELPGSNGGEKVIYSGELRI